MSAERALVVSVFPRGAPFGEPALVALSPASLDLLAYREFPPDDFLADPDDGERTPVRHARGLAIRDDRLFVSLFNSVGEYSILDAGRLDLELRRRFTAPAAADLHGISLRGQSLAAASTGGDCLVIWDTEGQAHRTIGVAGTEPPLVDIRFPLKAASRSTGSWRRLLPGRLHLNDVFLTAKGAVVCSLNQIVTVSESGDRSVLVGDPAALFHDARLLGEDQLMATDSARGEIVSLDLASAAQSRLRVTDPSVWFLRGLEVIDHHAYVLRSQVVANHQTRLNPTEAVSRRGAIFGLSVIDLKTGKLVADTTVNLADAPRGSVVYQLAAASADRSSAGHGMGHAATRRPTDLSRVRPGEICT